MYFWDWAESYGYKSYNRYNEEDKPEKQEEKKAFQMKVFLGINYIGEEIYIKCIKPLQSLNLSGKPIKDAFTMAIESGHYYGGIIPTKEDVNKEGFNFYSPDKKEKVFVGFNDLETIIQLEGD